MGGVHSQRKAVVIEYATGEYEGPVQVHTSAGDDRSSTNLDSNQGFAALTFPLDYTGTCSVKVVTADGVDLDTFEIEVK